MVQANNFKVERILYQFQILLKSEMKPTLGIWTFSWMLTRWVSSTTWFVNMIIATKENDVEMLIADLTLNNRLSHKKCMFVCVLLKPRWPCKLVLILRMTFNTYETKSTARDLQQLQESPRKKTRSSVWTLCDSYGWYSVQLIFFWSIWFLEPIRS